MADQPTAGLTSKYVFRHRRGMIMQPVQEWRVVTTSGPPAVITGTYNQDSLLTVALQIPHDAGLALTPEKISSPGGSNQRASLSTEPGYGVLDP